LQLVVHLVCFLHMSRSSEGGWNLISFVFTLVILFIVVALSVWIIWSMHFNMMIH
jgi:cytochrome o ubiquinol oxidase subunit IV